MTRTLIVSIILLGLFAVGVQAQDPGIPDTVELIVTVSPDAQANQLNVLLEVWVFNDEELIAANMGFSWDNPNLTLDSAIASALTDDGFQIGPFFYEDNSIAITNANQRFLFGGVAISPLFSADSSGRRLWASYYFTLSSWNETDQINIDTLEFNDASTFQFVRGDQIPFIPDWFGGLTIIDPNAPSDIVLSKDSLSFSSIEGGPSPAFQEFDISSSSGEIIDFSLSENAPWLIVTPISGNTPRTIRVTINNIGLTAGNYAETIIVNSAAAANTPLEVEITLDVALPPPTIGLSPNIFFFNAIAGEANPDTKILTITNTGGSTLDWSASNSESWLNINPVSGGDSNDVTISIDITGLPFGEYADTIIVSDPQATNSPTKVPVNLSVASDLPIIVVDSPSNFIIIKTGTGPIDSVFFYVRNGGGGTMNFWVESGGSPRIFGIEPDTSVAPDSIKVTLK
ncbi:MAG: BACON domain-containing protein, partial [candidate division Zixibacteria bacterium]|nr:BACON domain-containing protein [candidate division Zixibacteria bacterium]